MNQVYGNISWVLIYFVSGFFGNMMRYYYRYLILGMISPILFLSSCIFSADSISVGSSGAVLGMLSSWIVWILFRWNRIPERARGNRNCQLAVVLACVAITLGTSFSKYIDWAAHYGGASMGILWGILLISRELQNENHKVTDFSSCRIFIYITFSSSCPAGRSDNINGFDQRLFNLGIIHHDCIATSENYS